MARKLKPEDIINKVEQHYDSTEPLRSRMESDYSLYKLDPFDAGDGFQSYTSNEPSTYADKIISFLGTGKLNFNSGENIFILPSDSGLYNEEHL